MKDYLIWLKSGSSLEGVARKSDLLELRIAWEDYRKRVRALPFWILMDEEGEVSLDLDRIEAIAINEPKAEKIIKPCTGVSE